MNKLIELWHEYWYKKYYKLYKSTESTVVRETLQTKINYHGNMMWAYLEYKKVRNK
jgi:hypothetical protein